MIVEAEVHSWVLFAWSVAGYTVGCWLDLDHGIRGAFLVAGVLAVQLNVGFGRWTDELLRARLQAGQ